MTKTGLTEQAYFEWLYKRIGAWTDGNPGHSYFMLSEQLYNTPFEWSVPNDDNRETDGKQLRDDFADVIGSYGDETFMLRNPCNMLEMLIALAKRMDYEITEYSYENGIGRIFWHILGNVGLQRYNDDCYTSNIKAQVEVDAILQRIIQRKYGRNGKGGLFPLQNPTRDQRKTELWYQMSLYIMENSDIAE